MNRCRDCALWTLSDDKRHPHGFGECKKFLEFAGYYVWREEPLESQPTTSDVVVENDEGWAAFVGPDFGCIHWTAKS